MPNTASASASDSAAPNSLTALIHNAAPTAESSLSAEALSDKQVASYIRSLSNFSLVDLRTQPQQLQTKSEALHRQLSQLCISQTDAFIHIHQAEQQFAPSLTTFANRLEDLIVHTLPQLQEATEAFASASKPVLAERERVQNVVDQYERGHLSDLLEIPPLVLTCVRSGHHSDAIQLAEYLAGLLESSASHGSIGSADGHSLSNVNKPSEQRNTYLSLLIETLSHLAVMKTDLISSFSKPGLKLPAALKSTGVLRRLTHFERALPRLADWHTLQQHHSVPHLSMSEAQLCLAFLKSRIRSFHSALDAMGSSSSSSSQTFLRRYIDLWREEMTDTLSMAFALFVDTDPQGTPHHADDATTSDMVTPAYLISSFATSGFERLRDTISTQLVASVQATQASSSGHSASLSSLETLAELFANVHTQLSYASASLTRFGFDFGTLLCAPSSNASSDSSIQSLSTIEATWLDALTRSLDQAFSPSHALFDQNLKTSDATLPSQWLLSSQLPASALENLFQVSTTDPTSYDDFSRPNIELVDYPPLGKLLNRLLEWINALQVFAPTALAPLLLRLFDQHFARLSRRLLSEVSEAITRVDADTVAAERLLSDGEAQSLLQHLDQEEKRELQTQLVRDRESVILIKVLEMWQHSVVDWTRNVIASQIYDTEVDAKGEVDIAWAEAKDWIGETRTRIVESNKQRRQNAASKKKKVNEDLAREKAEAEERARVEAEERAKREKEEEEQRRKAEEEARLKSEEEARLKAEEEARLKAEEEARLKAEEEARLKAEEARLKEEARLQEEARLKAEEEARVKAEEEARLKAEAEAKAKDEAEAREAARLKAEEEAQLKAEEEARLKAEEEARLKAEEQARLKAEEEAKLKAEEEEQTKLKAQAKAEAAAAAAAEAAKAEEAARLKAEEEAKVKTEEEAKSKAEEAAKAQQESEEAAHVAAEDVAVANAADDVPSTKAGFKVSAVGIGNAAEPTQQPANDDTDRSRTSEAKEEALDKNAQPAPSAAAPKKFSLAEKLRLRKEERDRAAAAAAASQKPKEEVAAAEESIDAAPTAVAVPANTSDETTTTKNGEEHGDSTANAAVSATTEDKEQSTSSPDATEAVGEDPADEGEDDADDAEDNGDGDGSGTNTPATPTTPNPEATPSSGAAKKKKKNKKKKK
ncbi:hypothetical protein PHSY_005863 [Pseudozyma hubeiensis SY62]|uniref:Conserved oligomeric Golgi complex subunit 8 n=1 Tax=Pseudozyma hubeiensis (strain SY62) TaxID=1305764 RepID=R9PA80_PSEHS|nr:hypothetical protein PHSY_005863 [Pseudozyma hubeiensis SY62]GAC98271.1 hypothetical protein PHSY_005863 [Pseudozyma hubeiensis SY62]